MNYELAKQLKDAGFPTKRFNRYDPIFPNQEADDMNHMSVSVFKIPLSELIEACGGDFYGVFTLYEKNRITKKWAAVHRTESSAMGGEAKETNAFGSTPDEALAKLWLEINKK